MKKALLGVASALLLTGAMTSTASAQAGYYYDRDDYYDDDYYVERWDDLDRDGLDDRYDRYDDRRYIARHRYHAGRYYAPYNYRNVRYSIGSRLPRSHYGITYYIDYRPYGLYAPSPGYRWNRVGSDAYLVAVTNGVVRDVIYSLFY